MAEVSKPISYEPTDGLTYDPLDPGYWQPELLAKEMTRVFEICHGCRMCFKYCDSFPTLFKLLDQQYEGDVRRLNGDDVQSVMDACFQCKLCEVQCPYTPRDQHAYQLDFPRLVHRYDAIRARESRPDLRDVLLKNPDSVARFARMSFGLANALNRVQVHRWFMEKLLGIHRNKLLPEFSAQTFEDLARRENRIAAEPGAEVVLFQTCYVQNNEPQIGFDTLAVLDQNRVPAVCAAGLECCGMPAWESGDLAAVQGHARKNLDTLSPFVDSGAKILAINPTCSMMLRREYPELVVESDRPRARQLAAAVMDPGEFLWTIRNQARFSTDFKSTPRSVAYHAPCHLRAQAVGFKGRDLLRKIPGLKISSILECCGHDGTFAMKVEGFETSQRVGQRAFAGMQADEADVWATECPLAGLQFEQHAGKRPLHPMTILARAYRADGFAEKIPPPSAQGDQNS